MKHPNTMAVWSPIYKGMRTLLFMSKQENTMTVSQFASMGGKARAEKLTAKRMSEIGKLGAAAAKASGKRLGRPPKAK